MTIAETRVAVEIGVVLEVSDEVAAVVETDVVKARDAGISEAEVQIVVAAVDVMTGAAAVETVVGDAMNRAVVTKGHPKTSRHLGSKRR